MREVAGTWTALDASLTAPAMAERLRAWRPGVQALLRPRCPAAAGATLPHTRRCLGLAGSRLQAPGATGTDYRLPSLRDLRPFACVAGLIPANPTGATLQHWTLGAGEVAGADRGYAQAQGLHETVQRGAAVVVRVHPCSVVLLTATGAPVSLPEACKRQAPPPIRTGAVVRQATGGPPEVRGWGHA